MSGIPEHGKHFLLYWLPETAEREFAQGLKLNHAASDQFGRVRPGDTLWVVTAPAGSLKLVGRMRVAEVVGQRAAERRVGKGLWAARLHALPARGTEEPMKMLPLGPVQADLRFESPTSPTLESRAGRVNPQQLQTLRELTKASSATLERLWTENASATEASWRGDRRSASSVLDQLLPVAVQRRAYLGALEAAIRAAHAISDASWSVSLFTNAIRLNVGQMEVLTLSRDDVYLLLDPSSTPPSPPAALKPLIKPSNRYKSVPGPKVLLHLTGGQMGQWYPLLRNSHEAMAVRAATAKRRTPHSHAYSESVLLEAERTLGRALPRPSFLQRNRQFVVLIAMKEDLKLLRGSLETGKAVEWVVPKTCHAGDDVAIYLPATGFVATGRISSDPSLGAGFGRHQKSWRAEVSGVRMLEEAVPIESIAEALPRWKWPRYPKSLTTVPAEFVELLREVLARARQPGKEELPEQAGADEAYVEGAATTVRVNAFETSAVAKRRCVDHYGCQCFICGFDFEKKYGKAAAGIIHVHHLVPLASIRREYEVNPVKDLRPVCPNCHALVHRRSPPYTPKEVQSMIAGRDR